MRNIKFIYMYDGTDFLGFQRQPKGRTVQGVIEEILYKVTKEEVTITSSGRTDRGVHAHMQVSNFITHCPIPADRLLKAINNMLPQDISIQSCEEVELDFNARYSARERVYRYYLTTLRSPFENRFATYMGEKIELSRFLSILETLVGKHDFRNFRLSDCTSKHQVREIYSIHGEFSEANKFFIEIKGNGFLKSQIRIIMGTALEIYHGKKPIDYFKTLLSDFEKDYAKVVAPPNGLTLFNIKY